VTSIIEFIDSPNRKFSVNGPVGIENKGGT
jgi:hypothetical protein